MMMQDLANVTIIHCHLPETKKASEDWRHTSSPKSKKFRTQKYDSLLG
jgi:hypothetical protein